MASKKRGGRVTPKGTQPAGTAGKHEQHDHGPSNGPSRAVPGRPDLAHGRAERGPIGPTRSGHHRGNR